MADRQVGGLAAHVDAQLVSVPGPQVGGLGLLVEGTLPTGVNYGWLGTLVEVVVPQIVTITGTAQITLLGLTISASGVSTAQTSGVIRITLFGLSISATGTSTVRGVAALVLLIPWIQAMGTVIVVPPPPDPIVLPYQQARDGTATTLIPPIQSPIVSDSGELEPPPPGTATGTS